MIRTDKLTEAEANDLMKKCGVPIWAKPSRLQTLEAPEIRSIKERELVRTMSTKRQPKGLLIGSAHIRKPSAQSYDADLLQRAILDFHDEPHNAAMTAMSSDRNDKIETCWACNVIYVITAVVMFFVLAQWAGYNFAGLPG